MKNISLVNAVAGVILLASCAGIQRDCSSCMAEDMGADWIVVQYRYDGTVAQCWRLIDTGIKNEDSSDGIYWLSQGDHLVHISGWYNRVQVENGDWDGAAKALRVDLEACSEGAYTKEAP